MKPNEIEMIWKCGINLKLDECTKSNQEYRSTEVTTKEIERAKQAEAKQYYVHQYIANSNTKPMQNQMLH